MFALKRLILLTLLLGAFAGLNPAAAQDPPAFVPYQTLVMTCVDAPADDEIPLLALYGEVCTWSPGAADIHYETSGVYATNMVMSPDGRYVLVMVLSAEFVAGLLRGEDPTGGSGPLPVDFALLDLSAAPDDPARFRLIIDQNTLRPSAAEEGLQRRSTPVWSPDSTRFAWVELDPIPGVFSGRLVTYEIRTETVAIIARRLSLGWADAGEWDVPGLIGWGSVLVYSSWNAGVYGDDFNNSFGEVLDLFTPEGYRAGFPITYFANFEDRLSAKVWVQNDERGQLALYYPNLGWVLYDPATHDQSLLTTPPFRQAITGTGWRATWGDPGASYAEYPDRVVWQGTGDLPAEVAARPPLTFDPAGTPVWRNEAGDILTLRDGALVPLLPATDATLRVLVWTPAVWRTDGLSTPLEPRLTP